MRMMFLVIVPAALWVCILSAFSGGHHNLLTAALRRMPGYVRRIEGIHYAAPAGNAG